MKMVFLEKEMDTLPGRKNIRRNSKVRTSLHKHTHTNIFVPCLNIFSVAAPNHLLKKTHFWKFTLPVHFTAELHNNLVGYFQSWNIDSFPELCFEKGSWVCVWIWAVIWRKFSKKWMCQSVRRQVFFYCIEKRLTLV